MRTMRRDSSRAPSMRASALPSSRGKWPSWARCCAPCPTCSTIGSRLAPEESRAAPDSAAFLPISVRLGRGMDVVHPEYFLGLLDCGDVEVHHHRLLAAAQQHAFEHLVFARVDLLVRHEGRDPDEIPGPRLGGELERLAPAHARLAAHDEDDTLHRAVVVGAGLGVGQDVYRPRPDLLRAHAREVDRRGARHALGLRHVGVEVVAMHDAHAVVLPFVGMRFGHQSLSVSLWVGRHTRSRRSAWPTAKSRTRAKTVRTRMPAKTVLISKAPSAWWMR